MTCEDPSVDALNGHAANAQRPSETPPAATTTADSANACTGNELRRSGAPKGNWNRLRTARRTMRVGTLPRELRSVQNSIVVFRKALYGHLAKSGIEVTLPVETLVQAILRLEQAALVCQHLQRTKWDELSVADRLKLLGEINAATESRDRKLKLLGVGMPGESAGSSLDAEIRDHFAGAAP